MKIKLIIDKKETNKQQCMICFFCFAVLKGSENVADLIEEKPYGDQGTMSKLI